jgi:hypothetical protein
MNNNKRPVPPPHFMLGSSLRNWLKLLGNNKRIDRPYFLRALSISLGSLCTAPLRIYGRSRYSDLVNTTTIDLPPIFILGHWRTGTSHLHNLMSLDKNIGYATNFQVATPESFLGNSKVIKQMLAKMIPPTRPMDNVPLLLDGPTEEEFILATVSPYSVCHGFSFPKNARYYFEKYALFRGVDETVLAEWKKTYLTALRKTTLSVEGKQLLLKNPANTSRISILLDLFPDAKFVHIYRNPYDVFLSTINLYRRYLPCVQLQEISPEEVEANVLFFFREMMQKMFAEQSLIPPENFVEVKFEDLETDAILQLRRIYQHLNLPGFSTTEPAFRDYLTSQQEYQKNKYSLTDETIEKVNQHWGFAIDKFGYQQLEVSK